MVSSMDNSSPSPQTVMKWKTVLAIFVVVVAYLVTGGLVFRALEQPFESNQKNTIALEKSEFLQKHPCVKSGELEALIQWQIKGYGNIAPSTEGGKIFCIFYALFGIPLFGFLLAGIGDQLGTIFVKSIARVEKKKQITQTKIRVISTIMFILLGCIVFVTIPAVIFQSIEEWETLDSLYFVVITLTTVGFGDYVAGYGNIAPSTEGGKIFCIFYALFGIPLFGFLLAGIGDQLGTIFVKSIARVEKVFRKKQITQTKIRVISTIMFILLGCIVFVTIPAVIFQSIEEWETLDSLYFVVITLTTVGFGDYVAAYKFLC
ncbi:Potassium channel subfamily K member 10 [Acipenser ruthenus]|uniref:Potassium channel subfamily K member 10 n=1 Tax=Acipenser ruthenus TaxID=7906 RepID=A0A444V5M1_ACIRT|nr:Potassium channel subfamily K member 10 [Acipenser ruthenus]